MLNHIDQLIKNWADEIQTIMERSPLSYPNASSIARINEGGSRVPGPICPEMLTTRRVTAFHLIYKDLRNSWKKIIYKRYIQNKKISNREYEILNMIHGFIEGRITA